MLRLIDSVEMLFLSLLLLPRIGLLHSATGSKDVFGAIASSVLLDPEVEGNLSNSDVIWEFLGSNRKIVTILDYDPIHPLAEPNRQFKSRLSFNASNGSLMLNGLKPSDQGVYIITVDGKKRGSRVLKLIKPLPEPSISIIHLNTTIKLTCQISEGKVSSILWQKGDKMIRNTERYWLMQNNSVLTISEANKSDCGIYTCIVKNPVSRKNCSFSFINDKDCESSEPAANAQTSVIVIMLGIFVLLVALCIMRKWKKKTFRQMCIV